MLRRIRDSERPGRWSYDQEVRLRTARRQDAKVAAKLTMTGVCTGASGAGARRADCASRGKKKTVFLRKVKRLSFRAKPYVIPSERSESRDLEAAG